MSILITGGTVISMNPRREVIIADVLIENDRIADIGNIDKQRAEKVIDARGKLVIPGLIQSHTHLCQALFRGMADDLELLDWLRLRIWPLEASHDEESLYDSACLGCGELLRGGTTSIIDMGTVNHTDAIFTAVAEAGIRYLGGKCMMDYAPSSPLEEKRENSIQESIDLLEKWHGKKNGRIRYAFCPRFVPSCTEELLLEVKDLAAKHQAFIHTHAAENKDEIALVEKLTGQKNIIYLNDLGLCNNRLVLAHCIHISAAEKEILAASGTHVAHCPSSNLKLASGFADIPGMLNKQTSVSLGADGAPCNNNMSMFVEMRLAALIHKPFHGSTSMPAQTVFEMATLGGAKAMGMENELGSIEVGKKADIAVVNINHWHNEPIKGANVYAQLVYQCQTSDVECTIVDGKVLMQNGKNQIFDEQLVCNRANKSLLRVSRNAGIYLS